VSVGQATEYIISQSYSESAIKQYIRVWQKLQDFAHLHDEEFFSLELAAKFMKEIYEINDIFKPNPKTERWRVRYVWCLDDFNKDKCFVRHREYNVPLIPKVFTEIYFLYEDYLTNKNQKSCSISTKMARIKIFLLFLNRHGISKTEEVSPDTIIDFIGSLKYSAAYRGNILITLRDFLNCPTIFGLFQKGLEDILKSIQLNRYERLPSFYSNEEVTNILLAVDRNTSQGKKDYAIIILAVELGLRVSDIRKLQMDEIKWDKGTIELFQEKTGEFVQLYMTDNVKWALLDYLMKARPSNSEYHNVFLRSKAPYTPYSNMTSFYERINKYISLAGVKTKGKHHGLHSCRHGLATRLMSQGVPITVVSEVLGHKFANVTKDYIRIDIPQLRLVALEVSSDV
jgi:integrase